MKGPTKNLSAVLNSLFQDGDFLAWRESLSPMTQFNSWLVTQQNSRPGEAIAKILAWLLDSRGSHGLGLEVMRRFVELFPAQWEIRTVVHNDAPWETRFFKLNGSDFWVENLATGQGFAILLPRIARAGAAPAKGPAIPQTTGLIGEAAYGDLFAALKSKPEYKILLTLTGSQGVTPGEDWHQIGHADILGILKSLLRDKKIKDADVAAFVRMSAEVWENQFLPVYPQAETLARLLQKYRDPLMEATWEDIAGAIEKSRFAIGMERNKVAVACEKFIAIAGELGALMKNEAWAYTAKMPMPRIFQKNQGIYFQTKEARVLSDLQGLGNDLFYGLVFDTHTVWGQLTIRMTDAETRAQGQKLKTWLTEHPFPNKHGRGTVQRDEILLYAEPILPLRDWQQYDAIKLRQKMLKAVDDFMKITCPAIEAHIAMFGIPTVKPARGKSPTPKKK